MTAIAKKGLFNEPSLLLFMMRLTMPFKNQTISQFCLIQIVLTTIIGKQTKNKQLSIFGVRVDIVILGMMDTKLPHLETDSCS